TKHSAYREPCTERAIDHGCCSARDGTGLGAAHGVGNSDGGLDAGSAAEPDEARRRLRDGESRAIAAEFFPAREPDCTARTGIAASCGASRSQPGDVYGGPGHPQELGCARADGGVRISESDGTISDRTERAYGAAHGRGVVRGAF